MSDPLWIFVFSSSVAALVILQRQQEHVSRVARAGLAATVLVLALVIIETLVEIPVDPVYTILFYALCLVVMVVATLYEAAVDSRDQAP